MNSELISNLSKLEKDEINKGYFILQVKQAVKKVEPIDVINTIINNIPESYNRKLFEKLKKIYE